MFRVVVCSAVTLATGCLGSPPEAQSGGEYVANSEASTDLGIVSWEVQHQEQPTRLLGLDANAEAVVDMKVQSPEGNGGPVDLIFIYPEEATLRLFPDGRLSEGGSARVRGYAAAAYADLKRPESILAPSSDSDAVEVLAQGLTSSGTVHYNSNLFGHHETVIRGPNPCPGGATRTGRSVRGRNVPSRCGFDGWRTGNTQDCRLYIEVDIPSLTSENCDWSVTY